MKQIKLLQNITDDYKLEPTGYQLNGAFVPLDVNNRHYQETQKLLNSKKAELVPQYTEQDVLNKAKQDQLNALTDLANKKTNEAKNYIAGQKVTPDQVERYKIKYQEAVKAIQDSNYNYFVAEATLKGVAPKDLAQLVKARGDEWNTEIAKYVAIIEAYRVKAKSIIENTTTLKEFILIAKFLNYAKTLPANTTTDELVALFNSYGDFKTKLLNNTITLDEVKF